MYTLFLKNRQILRYEDLMPELFFVPQRERGKPKYVKNHFHHLCRTFQIYRGILIIHRRRTAFQKESYSAFIYNWKRRKKFCISVQFNLQDLHVDIEKFLDTYQSQVVYNKDNDIKGVVRKRVPCNSILCPNFTTCTKVATCQGIFRIRHVTMNYRYFYICPDRLFVRRDDKELQVNPKLPSPFLTEAKRTYLDKKNSEVKVLTNEDGSAILLA